jgi:hydroxypyruvate isomerase
MTAYDFFNQHRYKGDIYKVSNPRNQSLYDYCHTPEDIAKEQLRIENELKNMSDKLWEPSQHDLREAEAKKAAEAKAAEKKAKDNAAKAPKKAVATTKKTVTKAPAEAPKNP